MNDKEKKELIWIIAVIAVLLGAAAGNLFLLNEHRDNIAQNIDAKPTYPANATIIHVNATQWSWDFIYPNGTSTVNSFTVTVNHPVVLIITSVKGAQQFAVIHDLSIPQLAIQVYAVPGQNNSISFTPTKVGSFYFECVEYCGLDHYLMRGYMDVVA
ncbi:MAG: hypothetical protein M1595_01815 [Candidatus Thermoplasmatota archaeon]|jgi:heme/copper-type cytochrome/quinol oxidase subunit 2|nr:hypothetical protein [Candidatus Thermoplasmatota archaeon]